MMVLKLGKKTITIKMKFNQDFLVQVTLPNLHDHESCTVHFHTSQECDVDGEISSRMKVILARQ